MYTPRLIQIEDGSLPLELSVFDPLPLIEHLFQKYSVQARSKDVTMNLSVELSYSNFVIDQQHCIRMLGQSLHHHDHSIITISSPYHQPITILYDNPFTTMPCHHTKSQMLSHYH